MNETPTPENGDPAQSEPSAADSMKAFAIHSVGLQPMPADEGTPPESRLGDRLKFSRQSLELSVEGLSRLTKTYDAPGGKGISPPTLARYESGDTMPNVRELRLLGEALGVPVQWLVDGALPNLKGQQQAQALLAALSAYIRFVQSDVPQEFYTMTDWQRDRRRQDAIEEARRPSSKA